MFVGPPFHAMPFGGHVDYAASSVFINLTDTRKWFGKEKAQWHLNPRILDKHKGKEGVWKLPCQLHVDPLSQTNAGQTSTRARKAPEASMAASCDRTYITGRAIFLMIGQ